MDKENKIKLTNKDRDLFLEALDNPPEPSKKLQSLAKTLCYDEGKQPIMSLLSQYSDEELAVLLEAGDWIDISFLAEITKVMKKGADKYTKDNWRKGTNFSKRLNSAGRHLLKFSRGEDLDDELNTNHLANVAVNAMFVYYWQRMEKGLDDRLNI